MAFAREIVDFLSTASREVFLAGADLRCDNFAEAFRRPSVSYEEGNLVLKPGSFDAAVARLSVTVKGSTFIRVRDNPLWYPEEDDDLLGVRSFVNGASFKNFGYDIGNPNDRNECRKATLKILSDILDRQVKTEEIFARRYQDFRKLVGIDFDNLKEDLAKLDCVGFLFDQGHWVGRNEGKDLVGSSRCAMALIESFDGAQARAYVYADIPEEIFEKLGQYARDGGNDEFSKEIQDLFRGQPKNGVVRLLLSSPKVTAIWRQLRSCESASKDETFSLLQSKYSEFDSRWARKEKSELSKRRIGHLSKTDILGDLGGLFDGLQVDI